MSTSVSVQKLKTDLSDFLQFSQDPAAFAEVTTFLMEMNMRLIGMSILPVFFIRGDGRFLSANETFTRLFQLEGNVEGLTPTKILPLDFSACVDNCLDKAINTGETAYFSYKGNDQTGKDHMYSVRLSRTTFQNQRDGLCIGVMQEITDFNRFETVLEESNNRYNQLHESEEKYRRIADELPSIIMEFDLDLNLVYINRIGLNTLDCQERPGGLFRKIFKPDTEIELKHLIHEFEQGRQNAMTNNILLDKLGKSQSAILLWVPVLKNRLVSGLCASVVLIQGFVENTVFPESGFYSQYNLSSREKEVLQKLISGLKYEEIAEALHISLATVRTHIQNIYNKMGINSKAELFSIVKGFQLKHFGSTSFIAALLADIIQNK